MSAGVALPRSWLWSGLLYGVVGAILFSGKAIIIKLAYRHGVDATTLIGLRMAFAAPLFLAVAWMVDGPRAAGRRAERRPGDVLRVVGLGVIGYYLSSYLDFLGLQYVTASLERIVLYLSPTLVLLISVFWLRRPARRAQWLALGVSYAGVVVVFLADLEFSGPHLWRGVGLVFASACTYAIYLTAAGEMVQRLGSLRLTAWASLVASVCCVVQALVLTGSAMFTQPAPVYGLSVVNAVLCTVVPLFLIMFSVERLGPATASQVGLVGPVATIGMGAVLLDEPVSVQQLLGTAVVIAGVVLLTRAATRQPRPGSA